MREKDGARTALETHTLHTVKLNDSTNKYIINGAINDRQNPVRSVKNHLTGRNTL